MIMLSVLTCPVATAVSVDLATLGMDSFVTVCACVWSVCVECVCGHVFVYIYHNVCACIYGWIGMLQIKYSLEIQCINFF